MTAQDAPPALSARGFDRAAEERARPALLTEVMDDPGTRFVVVHRDGIPLGEDELRLNERAELPVAEEGPTFAFLGRLTGHGAVVAAVYPPTVPRDAVAPGAAWAGVRTHAALLPGDQADLLITAVSLGGWLIDSPFCPRCGSPTELTQAGWARRCLSCGRDHFPRTDPAVIMAVTSADDPDLLLLGSNAQWGPPRFSCFAGFVEAGESLEEAVVRELAEEAGVEVVAQTYRWSQAWPYPRSLMLGFEARAASGAVARPDGEEIVAVRWFTRDEIADALEKGATWDAPGSVTDGDQLQLPGRSSIAYRLIADWCDVR